MTDSLSQARRWLDDGCPKDVGDELNWFDLYGKDPESVIRKALSASVPGCGCEHCTKASIAIGIAQAAHGMMVDLGSFAAYWAGSVQQEVSSNDLARGGSTDSLERPRPHRKQEGVVRAEAATGSLPAGRLAQVTEGGSTPPADSDGAPLPQEGEKAPVTDPEKERLAKIMEGRDVQG